MHRELGITILLVSHSMEDVAEYVDRIIVMNHGAVMFDACLLYTSAKTVSPFTQENGYELAGAYQNGTVVESFGVAT